MLDACHSGAGEAQMRAPLPPRTGRRPRPARASASPPTMTSSFCQLGDVVEPGSANRNTFRSSARPSAASARRSRSPRSRTWKSGDCGGRGRSRSPPRRRAPPRSRGRARRGRAAAEPCVERRLRRDHVRVHRDEVPSAGAARRAPPPRRPRRGERGAGHPRGPCRTRRTRSRTARRSPRADGRRGLGLPEPGAVEVHGDRPLACPPDLRAGRPRLELPRRSRAGELEQCRQGPRSRSRSAR